MASSIPGKRRIPGEGRFSNIVGGVSRQFFVSCPLCGVSLVWKAFSRRSTVVIPRCFLFCIPVFFGSAVERPTMCPQVSGSNLACCRVFCFCFYCMGFSITFLFLFFQYVDSFFFFLEYYLLPRGIFCVPGLCFMYSIGYVPVLFFCPFWTRRYYRTAVRFIRTCFTRKTAL